MTDKGNNKKHALLARHRTGSPSHGVAHHKRGIMRQFSRLRAAGIGALAAFFAVLGPGLLAGLSDDDPAGITTYSVLGTDFGYRFLWVIPFSTILLIQYHLMAVRIGAATNLGFVGVIRAHWGRGVGVARASYGFGCGVRVTRVGIGTRPGIVRAGFRR